jgi:YD repeat-containing protein
MPIVTASTRSTFAFVAAASTNGRVVRLENADGEVHSLAYDGGAGRLVARKNLSTGASARRVFDERHSRNDFQQDTGCQLEFTNYKVLDGVELTRPEPKARPDLRRPKAGGFESRCQPA